MLQRAGRVEDQPLRGQRRLRPAGTQLAGQPLAQVEGHGRDAGSLLGVGGIQPHQVAIVLHHGGTARDVDDDGFKPLLDVRPPGIDVAAHVGQAACFVVHVIGQRAAAARLALDDGLDAQPVQHAGRGLVHRRQHAFLHAVVQHEDLAGMGLRGPFADRHVHARDLGLQRSRQEGTGHAADLHQAVEQRLVADEPMQHAATDGLAARTAHLGGHDTAANVEQPRIMHPRRTGALAVATGQAAVQVAQRGQRGRGAFQHLLHQVDAPARTVLLVTQDLIGGTGGRAEAAMHAGPQDAFGHFAIRRVQEALGKMGFHDGLNARRIRWAQARRMRLRGPDTSGRG